MEYDFEVKYIKGTEMGLADDLSRKEITDDEIRMQIKGKQKGDKIKNSIWKMHVSKIDEQ